MFLVANRAAGAVAALVIAAAGAYWLGQPPAGECSFEPAASLAAPATDTAQLLAQAERS
jgi:hypothetical protein